MTPALAFHSSWSNPPRLCNEPEPGRRHLQPLSPTLVKRRCVDPRTRNLAAIFVAIGWQMDLRPTGTSGGNVAVCRVPAPSAPQEGHDRNKQSAGVVNVFMILANLGLLSHISLVFESAFEEMRKANRKEE